MISFDNKKLMDLLHELGIKDTSPYIKIKCCDYSKAFKKENLEFLRRLNEFLYSNLEKFGNKEFYYIAGEMMNLSSKKFLSFCEKKALKYRKKPNIGCNVNYLFNSMGVDNNQRIPNEVFSRNFLRSIRNAWEKREKKISWQHYLYIIYQLGNILNLYGLPEENLNIHFMIFGNDYVYLQDKHKQSSVEPKKMWLLKDESLKKFLEENIIRECFEPKYYLSSHSFKQFVARIYTPIVLHILLLLQGQNVSRNCLAQTAQKIDKEWEWYVEYLKAIGFIQETRKLIQITDVGRQYCLQESNGPIESPQLENLLVVQDDRFHTDPSTYERLKNRLAEDIKQDTYFYYLTKELYSTYQKYITMENALYRIMRYNPTVSLFVFVEDKFPEFVKNIQNIYRIELLPALIVSSKPIHSTKDKIIKQKESAILKKGFFVNELCNDMEKLIELLDKFHEMSKKGKLSNRTIVLEETKNILGKLFEKTSISFV